MMVLRSPRMNKPSFNEPDCIKAWVAGV